MQQFDVAQYVPPDIQNDYNTASQYYDQFSQATQGVSVKNGRVELSPAATQAALAGFTAALTAVNPILGGAFAAFLALAPKAGSGPGVCTTDPPPGPGLSQLQAWKYYTPWSSMYGSYPLGAPGSFEAFANPLLEYNWALSANCFSSKWTPSPALLATLIATWNARHQGPSRTISRSGLNPVGFNPPANYDPIANALETAILVHCTSSYQGNDPFEQAVNISCTPNNVTSSFAINNGPAIVHIAPLTLHFGPTSAQVGLSVAQAMASKIDTTTGASSSTGIAAHPVATAAVVGAGVLVYGAATGAKWAPAFLKKLLR